MSLAVEQALSSRELQVDRPRSRITRHAAAESFKFNSVPNPVSGREECGFATPATRPRPSSYDSMQRQFYDAMDDHEIINTQPDEHVADAPAPVLPQKSALRASRLLDNLVSLKMEASSEHLSTFTQDPHDEYLSSEEEASSTAGDFSDFEYDSSSDDIAPSPIKECNSREVTARVVSVIFSGKPVVVDVPHVRRSISPSSIERPKSATAALLHRAPYDSCEEVKSRRPSVSTVSSSRSSRSSSRASSLARSQAPPHPPRSSSMLPLGTGNPKPFFLKIDPYANGSTYSLDAHNHIQRQQQQQQQQQQQVSQEPQQSPSEPTPVEDERPKTPRTPGKMFKGVARAMSLMKRRSQPRLNQAFLASPSNEHLPRAGSPSSRSIPEEPITEEGPAEQPVSPQEQPTETKSTESTAALSPPQQPPPPPPARPQLQPLTHDDILRLAAQNERASRHLSSSAAVRTFHEGQLQALDSQISPISPLVAASPNTAGKRMSSFGFGRRRMSVKLTGGKLQL